MNKELRATLHSMHRTSVNQFDMDLAARRIMENECAFDAFLAVPRYPWTELFSNESQFSLDSIKVSGLLHASVSTVKYNC